MGLTFGTAAKTFFTSESVTEGHPDKVCDQISDAVLDAVMSADPEGRVACETAATTGLVLVFGEITTSTYVDVQQLVRDVVRDIGYSRFGFWIRRGYVRSDRLDQGAKRRDLGGCFHRA